MAGAGLGLLLAYWLLDALVATDLELPLPVGDDLAIDGRARLHDGLAVPTGVIFGLAPAIQTSKPDVVPVLKNEIIPAGTTHRGLRGFLALRQVLVVTQIALARLSSRRGDFLRSLTRAERTDTGFETRGVSS